MSEWKEETCKSCDYCIDEQCRKYPRFKRVTETNMYGGGKSDVRWVKEYLPACAEYQQKKEGR